LKAADHIWVSRAETKGAFNTGIDTVNLHRPTTSAAAPEKTPTEWWRKLSLKATFESSSSEFSFKR